MRKTQIPSNSSMKDPERGVIKVSACGIFSEPTFKSEMLTQALMFEEVLIFNKKDNWYKVELKHDGYKGWIHEMYLEDSKSVMNNKDYKENFSKSLILDKAFKMLGKPYLWGGRSFQGYDCSGLVQTCINALGFSFPRDAKDQINSELLYEIKLKDICSGDLLFFEQDKIVNHVGITINSFNLDEDSSSYYGKIIHSSGSVKISNIIFDNLLYGIIDGNDEKKIKLYKIMRLKENV